MKQRNLLDSQIDLDSVKLYDKQGVLSERWQIVFKVWDFGKNGFIRKFDYDVNKLKTVGERYSFAKKRMKAIKKMLLAGYCANAPKVKTFTIETAFSETFAFKYKVLKRTSKNSIQNVLNQFFDFINNQKRLNDNILNLTKKDFYDFQEHLLNLNLSTRTVNNYVYYLHALLTDFSNRNNDYLPNNPAAIGKLRTIKTVAHRALTEKEKEVLLPALKRDEYRNLYLFIAIIYYMWIRPKEIYLLKIENFDFERKKMFVPAQDSKNNVFSWVSMPDDFVEMLSNYNLKKYPLNYFVFSPCGDDDKMFGHKPFKRNTFTEMHRKLCDNLGFSKDVVPYGWKRSGVESAAKNGMSIYEIKTHGRWQDLKMVAVYLKNTGIDLEEEKAVNLIKGL